MEPALRLMTATASASAYVPAAAIAARSATEIVVATAWPRTLSGVNTSDAECANYPN
jgi:hypothetical protein